MAQAPRLWRIELPASEATVDAVEAVLAPRCLAVSRFVEARPGRWRVEGIAAAEPDDRALAAALAEVFASRGLAAPTPTVEPLPDRDWVGDGLAAFPPLRIGRYDVRGSHVAEPPPAGAVAIRLDAGTAFGSGQHASTKGCLLVLDRLAKARRFARPLDLGCGSGILAIAIAKTWRVPVVAGDIDPEAARVAGANARVNGVARSVRIGCGPGYRPPVVAAGAPYDLVVANILARPLARMAGDLAGNLAPGGVAVLSGLVAADAPWLAAAHRLVGLSVRRTMVIDGWATLVLGGRAR